MDYALRIFSSNLRKWILYQCKRFESMLAERVNNLNNALGWYCFNGAFLHRIESHSIDNEQLVSNSSTLSNKNILIEYQLFQLY